MLQTLQAMEAAILKGGLQTNGQTNPVLTTFLKQLMGLPKDWLMLLGQLTQQGEMAQLNGPLVLSLLQQFPQERLQLPQLQQWLQQHLGEGSSKLMQLLQGQALGYAAGGSVVMQEALETLLRWQQAAGTNPTEALNTLMTLYASQALPPGLPIHMQWGFERFKTGLGEGGTDEQELEAQAETALVLLIETVKLGRLKASLVQAAPRQLLLHLRHTSLFTRNLQQKLQSEFVDNKPVPAGQQLEWQWALFANEAQREELAANSPDAEMASNAPPEAKDKQPEVGLYPQQGVSLVVMSAGLKLARCVLELDQRAHRQAV